MTELGQRVKTFGPGYDAKLSAAGCIDKVQGILDEWDRRNTPGDIVPAVDMQIMLQAAQLWTALAQVHATALLALATEALAAPKKTCRCIRD